MLIEVDDSFLELASEVEDILNNAGFVLIEKKSAEINQIGKSMTLNQIWKKQLP